MILVNRKELMSNETIIEQADKRICGELTRAGTPCKKSPMVNGKCHLHGGKALKGAASPSYKHGRYSKYMPRNLHSMYLEFREDAQRLSLVDEIDMTRARIGELLSQLSSEMQDSPEMWEAANKEYESLILSLRLEDPRAQARALQRLGMILEGGAEHWRRHHEIDKQKELLKKLVESQRKAMIEAKIYVSADQISMFMDYLFASIKEHVTDQKALSALSADIYDFYLAKNNS